jgi:hypothetical protein
MIGHFGVKKLQEKAKIHGFKFTGGVEVCQDFFIAKVRQKNVNFKWKGVVKSPR